MSEALSENLTWACGYCKGQYMSPTMKTCVKCYRTKDSRAIPGLPFVLPPWNKDCKNVVSGTESKKIDEDTWVTNFVPTPFFFSQGKMHRKNFVSETKSEKYRENTVDNERLPEEEAATWVCGWCEEGRMSTGTEPCGECLRPNYPVPREIRPFCLERNPFSPEIDVPPQEIVHAPSPLYFKRSLPFKKIFFPLRDNMKEKIYRGPREWKRERSGVICDNCPVLASEEHSCIPHASIERLYEIEAPTTDNKRLQETKPSVTDEMEASAAIDMSIMKMNEKMKK